MFECPTDEEIKQELDAMAAAAETIKPLSIAARRRVIKWLWREFVRAAEKRDASNE